MGKSNAGKRAHKKRYSKVAQRKKRTREITIKKRNHQVNKQRQEKTRIDELEINYNESKPKKVKPEREFHDLTTMSPEEISKAIPAFFPKIKILPIGLLCYDEPRVEFYLSKQLKGYFKIKLEIIKEFLERHLIESVDIKSLINEQINSLSDLIQRSIREGEVEKGDFTFLSIIKENELLLNANAYTSNPPMSITYRIKKIEEGTLIAKVVYFGVINPEFIKNSRTAYQRYSKEIDYETIEQIHKGLVKANNSN